MKSGLLALALVAAALVGCTKSAPDRALDDLEKRVSVAAERSGQAGRAAALGGVDSTSDSDEARTELEAVEKQLAALLDQDLPAETRDRAQRLQARIAEVREKMGIR